MSGCGRVTVEKYLEYLSEENTTIQVENNSSSTDWWGPVKLKLRDQIIEGMKENFRRSPLYLVKKNADITVVLQDISTVGGADSIQVEEVTLIIRGRKKEILKIRYKQTATIFPDDWYRIWRYAKDAQWIAQILADRVVQELGVRRVLMRQEVAADKRRPAKRGFIIYQPQNRD